MKNTNPPSFIFQFNIQVLSRICILGLGPLSSRILTALAFLFMLRWSFGDPRFVLPQSTWVSCFHWQPRLVPKSTKRKQPKNKKGIIQSLPSLPPSSNMNQLLSPAAMVRESRPPAAQQCLHAAASKGLSRRCPNLSPSPLIIRRFYILI